MSSVACTPERATELAESLQEVQSKVTTATGARQNAQNAPVLVAVSKLKPASDIMGCYQAGHRDFGENYVNELAEKAPLLPTDIRWHFIGTLQSNKAKILANIPNLYVIQTLTSAKTATALDRQLPADRSSPLNVMLQVNTSGEKSKSGLAPLHDEAIEDGQGESDQPTPSLEVVELASHVISSCPKLHLLGVMTVGSYEASTSEEPNPDFETLQQTRDALEAVLNSKHAGSQWGKDGKLLMSMGMSSDFEVAIQAGSDIVRIGTSIFGQRPKKQ